MRDTPSQAAMDSRVPSQFGRVLADMGIYLMTLAFILCTALFTWQALVVLKVQMIRDIQENLTTVLGTTHKSLHTWVHGRLDGARTLVGCIEVQGPS